MKKATAYLKAGVISLVVLCAAHPSEAQRGRHYYSYYPVRGQRFYSLPGAYFSLNFGGNPYYYSGGFFYRPYGGYFQLTFPPFGITVGTLPRGYWPLSYGGYPYYYYNGIFYRPNNDQYEVVHAPVGAEVPSIPRDAQATVIDGQKYYEYNGTYYRDVVKPNGEIWYRVEGKHGVLNTDKNTAPPAQPNPAPVHQGSQQPVNDSRPSIGEVFDELPAGYKTVMINSKKYFVSTDNVYYEEVMDGKQLRYKVAGK